MEESFAEAMHRAAAASTDSDFKMTDDEVERFSKAFEQEEFRKLFSDYVQEISDPKHRAEQEAMIRQMEADGQVPGDKELIHPRPGFVVKTHRRAGSPGAPEREKVFINVVCHEKLGEPTSRPGEKGGIAWSVPHSIGPQRVEADKHGARVPTRDVCFHPAAVEKALAEQRFRDLVVETSIDGWERASRAPDDAKGGDALERTYHVLRGVAYKQGAPVTMVLAREKEPAAGAPRRAARAAPPGPGPAAARAGGKRPAEPRYTVTYRGQHEVDAQRRGAPSVVRLARPRELVVRIELPRVRAASDMALDVGERHLRLSAARAYRLDLPLPYAVMETEGGAHFDKAAKALTVTLPVRPETAAEKRERLEVEAQVLRRTPQVPQPQSPQPPQLPQPPQQQKADPPSPEAPPPEAPPEAPLEAPPEAPPEALGEAEAPSSAKRLAEELGITPLAAIKTHGRAAKGGQSSAARRFAADALSGRAFIASGRFEGALDGYVFGRRGGALGYHSDAPGAAGDEPARGPRAPPYRVRQNERCVTVLVDVAGARGDSLRLEVRGRDVTIAFDADCSYELRLRAARDLQEGACRADAADANVAVVLRKAAEGHWDAPLLATQDPPVPAVPLPADDAPPVAPPVAPVAFQNKVMFELD